MESDGVLAEIEELKIALENASEDNGFCSIRLSKKTAAWLGNLTRSILEQEKFKEALRSLPQKASGP